MMATFRGGATVGMEALKEKLGEYVRADGAGETVLVTEGGKVVAELVPPRVAEPVAAVLPADATDAERQWADLIRRGIVTPAKRPRPAMLPAPPAIMTLEELPRDLDDSRSDR